MSEAYNFEDVSQEKNRKSTVWQGFFWLDKKKEVARCQKCLEKGVTKLMQSTRLIGTKSLLNHIRIFHKLPDSQSLSRNKTKPKCFAKRKVLGDLLEKNASSGISFRSIASPPMYELASVSFLYSYYWCKLFILNLHIELMCIFPFRAGN